MFWRNGSYLWTFYPSNQDVANDHSLEKSAISSFFQRTRSFYREKDYPIPPHVSFPQLVHAVSEKIADDPLLGYTIEAVMDFLQTDGLVSEHDYSVGNVWEHVPRYKMRGYRKLNPRDPSFVIDLMEELANGPVIAVFPICTNFDLRKSATLYLADGDIAMNEADPSAIVGLVVYMTSYCVIDGVPRWQYRNIYSSRRPERGHGNIELDGLFMAYAPIIDV